MLNSLVSYLDSSAEKFPEKLAISDGRLSLSFSELREASLRVASAIFSRTRGKNQPIAVEVDRKAQSIVLFLGVLYSGNFYVPIDKKMPQERMDKILEDTEPPVILCLSDKGPLASYEGLSMSYDQALAFEADLGVIEERVAQTIDMDPAYMIYTSGSTGDPKGVIISHRMVMDFSFFLRDGFSIGPDDVLANQAPFYFDCSVKCIYQMVINGASLHILGPSFFMFPIKTIEFFNEKGVTTLLWATSGLNILSSSGVFDKLKPKTLNKVFFSGEALYAKDFLPWKEACPDSCRFINLYGPTEVTVDCCYYEIEGDFSPDQVIPIGRACPNMEVFLLDEENKIAPREEIGEVCARGTGISYGYYNDPDKTQASFIQNPLHSHYRDIIYKTGDLARYNEEGLLVYVSRKDNQVKHQGNRIELGEVEAAAMAAPGVKEAVVFYDWDQGQIVLAYVGQISREDVLAQIKARLPRYMVPGQVLAYGTFPNNRNGKIDRVKIKDDYVHGNHTK